MKNEVHDLTEKEVQNLFADYPWLLDIDYETVTEFKYKGMEYLLSDNKRADLILRDRTSGRPVIIEFKAVPFYRENIGQILEYKARVISEATNENSTLREVFGDRTLSPIMVLVVPNCNTEARLACNLSGIEIYEYDKSVPEIIIPEKRLALDEFTSKFHKNEIPFDAERHEKVERIYKDMQSVLLEEGITDGWISYRNPPGEYFYSMNQLFVNKWLFQNRRISIGICENVFDDSQYDKITIEIFSQDKELLLQFIEEYRELGLQPENHSEDIDNTYYDGFFWGFNENKIEFFNKTKDIIRPYIKNYLLVYGMLKCD